MIRVTFRLLPESASIEAAPELVVTEVNVSDVCNQVVVGSSAILTA